MCYKTVEAEKKELLQQATRLREENEVLQKAHASSPHSALGATPSQSGASMVHNGSSTTQEQDEIRDLENNIRLLTAELERMSHLIIEKDELIQQLQVTVACLLD